MATWTSYSALTTDEMIWLNNLSGVAGIRIEEPETIDVPTIGGQTFTLCLKPTILTIVTVSEESDTMIRLKFGNRFDYDVS